MKNLGYETPKKFFLKRKKIDKIVSQVDYNKP